VASREFERKYVLPLMLMVCVGFIVVGIIGIVRYPHETLDWSLVLLFSEIAATSCYYTGSVRRDRAWAVFVLLFHIIGLAAAIGFWVTLSRASEVESWYVAILCFALTIALLDKTRRTLTLLCRKRT